MVFESECHLSGREVLQQFTCYDDSSSTINYFRTVTIYKL